MQDTPDSSTNPQIRILEVAADLLRALGDVPQQLYIVIADDIEIQISQYAGSVRERLDLLARVAGVIGASEIIISPELDSGAVHHRTKYGHSFGGIGVRAFAVVTLAERRAGAAGAES